MTHQPVTKKQSLLNHRGVTLVELIVASVMIGIVMVGVASFGSTIKRFQSSTNQAVIIEMRAKTALSQLSDDAYGAVGDNINPGYLFSSPGGNDRAICFRHDVNTTPEDYSDDSWICYFRNNANNTVYRCPAPTTIPPNNLGQCGAGNRLLIPLTQTDFFDIVETVDATAANNRLDYFDLYIFTRFDNTTATNHVTNPEYSVSTQVSPPGHSR